jgi:hypothetical protein
MATKRKIRECADCGVPESVSVTNTSPRCMDCGRARSALLRRRRVDRICTFCALPFTVPRSVISAKTNSTARFCSRPCYERFLCRTERTTGRGSQWAAARKQALADAPFCALCGTMHGLHVHHAIPFRLTRDNSQANLFPLCAKHHKVVEAAFVETEGLQPHPTIALLLWRSILIERQQATRVKLLEIRCAA